MIKIYIYTFLGCISALVFSSFLYSQYSDYRGRANVQELMFGAEGLQRELEENFKKTGKIDGGWRGNRELQDGVMIAENGVLVLKGRRGELLVLIPKAGSDGVQWSCYVGPEKDRPANCRAE